MPNEESTATEHIGSIIAGIEAGAPATLEDFTRSASKYVLEASLHGMSDSSKKSLQIALSLFEQQLIRDQAVVSIGREMVIHHDFDPEGVLESLYNGAQRGIFAFETLHELWPLLHEAGVLPPPMGNDQLKQQVEDEEAAGRQDAAWSPKRLFSGLKNLKKK